MPPGRHLLLAASVLAAVVGHVELAPAGGNGNNGNGRVQPGATDTPPIVIMHGIFGSADNLIDVVTWIEETLPGGLAVFTPSPSP